jgi:hypothetical protein
VTTLLAWSDGRRFGGRALSNGTADQFHFAVSAPLAEVLLGNLPPPVILDDPFHCWIRLEWRTPWATPELAEKRQVLYLTVDEPAGPEITHLMPLRPEGDLAGRRPTAILPARDTSFSRGRLIAHASAFGPSEQAKPAHCQPGTSIMLLGQFGSKGPESSLWLSPASDLCGTTTSSTLAETCVRNCEHSFYTLICLGHISARPSPRAEASCAPGNRPIRCAPTEGVPCSVGPPPTNARLNRP